MMMRVIAATNMIKRARSDDTTLLDAGFYFERFPFLIGGENGSIHVIV